MSSARYDPFTNWVVESFFSGYVSFSRIVKAADRVCFYNYIYLNQFIAAQWKLLLWYSTYTGLLTNFLSFTCFKYKAGLIYTLVDRTFKINNTTTGREKDLQQLSITLQRNSFPSHLIDKIIKGYKNKFSSRPTQNDTSTTGVNTTGIQHFKLPFVGDFSTVTRKKLKHLLDVFCKDIDIRIVFPSFKIKNFFSF